MFKWFSKLFKTKEEKKPDRKFSYCEPVTASSIPNWHIRKLGKRGLRPTGGADTKSLYGKEVSWDLGPKITFRNFE